jgi:hypothetical protein
MPNYLCQVSPRYPENYQIGLRAQRWGVERRYAHRIAAVKPGDMLVFLAAQQIQSIHRIESEPFVEERVLWPPKDGDPFPHRVRISAPLWRGSIAKDVFSKQLSFMRGKTWGGTVQGANGVFNPKLTDRDMAFLKSLLEKVEPQAHVQIEKPAARVAESGAGQPAMFRILGQEILLAINSVLPQLGLQRFNGLDFPAEYDLGYGGNVVLCRDQGNGALVVVDFTSGEVPNEVLLRILHYMSWTRQNVATNEDVRGIILAETTGDALQAMVGEVPSVQMVRYRLGIELLGRDVG